MFDVCFVTFLNMVLHFLLFFWQGTPQITEKSIDSQKAVDNKIKEKCEEFIAFTYDYLTMELKSFILESKWPAVAKASEGSVDDASDENSESTLPVKQCKLKLKESLEAYQSKKVSIERSMSLYLANPETEAIIFKQIKTKIQLLYEQLVKILLTKFPLDSERAELEIPLLKTLI